MKSTAVNTGLIMGSSSLIITLISYLAGPKAFISLWLLLVIFVISLTGFFYFAFDHRKSIGGFMTFGQAYKYCMLVMLIWVPMMVFSKYTMTLIDPEFFDQVDALTVEDQVTRAVSWGLPENQVDKVTLQAEEQQAKARTFVGQLWGMAFMYVVFSILNLIFALIIRKNKPEFA